LHANEVVGAQQLIETLYELASKNDEETLRILDEVIILLVHVNPDGMEIMSNWYMLPSEKTKRNKNIPVLYQKYVGHDNNRDFFMNNMQESTNISLQQYVEWMPQIVYNHHQSGPAGTVVAGPPYRSIVCIKKTSQDLFDWTDRCFLPGGMGACVPLLITTT
jgi:hypothetical protein